ENAKARNGEENHVNFFNAVLQAVDTLVQQNLGVFDGMGQNLFRAFATILVVWFGIKAALAADEHRGGFHFANFVSLILMISFGFAMVNYYDTPIPGFGRDFHHLITDEAAALSNQIGQANAQRIADDTQYVLGNLEVPGITQPIATFLYALLWLGAVVTEALALIVVAFGVVATALCILLGPVFIPFFIVPQFDWLFWGWLKAFIQYSFYQVVAAGVLFIVSQFTYGIIHAQITGLISATDLIRISPVLVVTYLAAIYAILKVPMLTSHIFSGTSGGSATALFEKIAVALGAAV
ncbi:MAG: type IV secretion system protein, partial [Candidatus Acidiferrales bacterium]